MAIAEMCPKCGKNLKAPDHLAGKRVKCLQSQTFFTLAGASPVHEEAPAPTDHEETPVPSVHQPKMEQPDEGRPAGGAVRAAFWLGLASVLLGLAAGILGLFPSTVGYSRIVVWLGITLGGGAVVLAIIREECGFGFPFTGAATSLLALGLVAFWLDAPAKPDDGMRPPGGPPGAMDKGPPPDGKGGPPPDWKGGPPGEKGKGGPPPTGPPA
jgi:hypothetical protein